MMKLAGKKIAITGAANGLGRAILFRVLSEGASVFGGDVDTTGLETMGRSAVELCGTSKQRVGWAQFDVSSESDVGRFVDAAWSHCNGLDAVVHCAGINRPADFLDQSLVDWRLIIDTNLTSTFLVGQAVARKMVAESVLGSIVNLSSIHATVARGDNPAYAASKGGVTQLTKSMAVSLGPYGVRVNAIAPGPCETQLTAARMQTGNSASELMRGVVLGRLGQPEDIASAAVYLLSDDSTWVTGSTLLVDGGILASR